MKRALIVEDNPDAVELFRIALEGSGVQCQIVMDGDAAIGAVDATVPDLVLLDLHLPGASGVEVLRHIRGDTRLMATKVVILTAHPEMLSDDEKADRILIKPISLNALRRLVDDVLGDEEMLPVQTSAIEVVEMPEAWGEDRVLESLCDGVLIFDHLWKCVYANPAAGRLLDLTLKDIVGGNLDSMLGGTSRSDAWVAICAMLDGHECAGSLWWGKHSLSTSVSKVGDTRVIIVRDIGGEIEEQRAVNALFAVATHELRTPLAVIKNFADLMVETKDAGSLRDYAQRVRSNAAYLILLVNNLLDHARLTANEMRLMIARLKPCALIDEVEYMMAVLADEKKLELSFRVDAAVPKELMGDEQHLKQILINLVSNGIKFTDEGQVNVLIYMHDDAHWAIAVEDTGCGIAPAAQSKIFKPFRVGENPATRKSVGAGLGLSIVKHLVDLMQGTITLTSEVGKGTKFIVVLPLAKESAVEERQLAVVIEDNVDLRQLWSRELRDAGLRVVEAETYESGMAALEAEIPSAVILDLRLGELSTATGAVLLEKMQADVRFANTQVVICTAYPSAAENLRGYSQLLIKPVGLYRFREVCAALAKPQPSDLLQSRMAPEDSRFWTARVRGGIDKARET